MLLRQIISVIGFSFNFVFVPVVHSQNIECPAIQEDISNVEFSLSTCREINLSDYVMSGPAVWLTITIDLTAKQIETGQTITHKQSIITTIAVSNIFSAYYHSIYALSKVYATHKANPPTLNTGNVSSPNLQV